MIKLLIVINFLTALFAFSVIAELKTNTPDMSLIPEQIELYKKAFKNSQNIEDIRTVALDNVDKFDASAKVVIIFLKLINQISITLIALTLINIALLYVVQRGKVAGAGLKE